MRKKILFGLLFLFSIIIVFAKPIDENAAKQAGANFLTIKTGIQANVADLNLVYTMGDQTQGTYFYVFNVRQDGFVIVAGDDDVLPILGYSNKEVFYTENISPSVKKWLENYKEQIRYVVTHNIPATDNIKSEWENLQKSNAAQRTEQTTARLTGVGPLVQVHWNQSPYVNAQCPYDNNYGELTVSGCVATAMAQIMKYWDYPAHGTGFHSYTHQTYGTLSANFGSTTYDWASMPSYVNSSNDAVATLMYQCGVAVEMNYGVAETGGSGSFVIEDGYPVEQTAENAYKTFFDYDASTLQGLRRYNYSDSEWIQLLKNDLNAGRPIQYAGFGNAGGHTWVCDGYDNNNFFHMNWGWGGNSDGYFNLNALNPPALGTGGGSGGFNSGQQAIIGIQPANDGTPQNYDLRLYSDLNMSDTEIFFGSDFSLTLDIGNFGTGSFSGQVGAAVFDSNNNFVDFMEIEDATIQNDYYNTITFDNTTSTLFVPGIYHVEVFYKNNVQDWTVVADGNYTNIKEFEVYYSADIETNSDFSITTDGGTLYQEQSATINVDALNTASSTFYGDLRVDLANLDGTFAQTVQEFSITGGLPTDYHYTNGIDFTGTITVPPGTYLMELGYKAQGSSDWYYAGSSDFQNPVFVTVEAPPYSPDQYENNNSFAQSYTFSPSFSGNIASVNTTGSNIDVGSDNDFYKITLPSGYDYTISARLQDSYSSNDGNTYTVDALFSYSIDNGSTWSDVYDTSIENDITIQNGGEVTFHIAPYFEGNTGTYLFDIDLNRQTLGTKDFDVDNRIKIYPNPAKAFVNVDFSTFAGEVKEIKLSNTLGQVVGKINVNNKNSVKIPLENLASGVYFVQINSTKGISTKKIIVNK